MIKTTQENEIEIENNKSYLTKYSVDIDRLYNMLSDDDSFHLKKLLSFFIDEEIHEELVKKDRPVDENNRKFDENHKFKSILLENAFKEVSNLRSSFGREMKDEGSFQKNYSFFQRNIKFHGDETSKRKNFSETFKMIENKWGAIITATQNTISKNFSLKSFVFFILFYYIYE